jgi:ParB family chromosome partitioning protein
MPSKNFSGALSKQRAGKPGGTAGVVGDLPSPLREEIEQSAEHILVQQIALDYLHDNPFQHLARPVLDEEALEDLAGSIRQNGFYGALLARPEGRGSNEYQIAYGHRRREAARRAGLKTLPVKIMDLTDLQMAQLMASENFSREDLTPLGEANIVGHLYTDQNMSIEQIAAAVGKKRGWVQPRIALYQAPQDVRQLVEQKPQALSHARLLQQVKDAGERAALIEQVIQNDLTFEQLNSFISSGKTGRPFKTGNIDTKITNNFADVNSEGSHNQKGDKNRTKQPVTEITNNIADVDGENRNNVSHETNSPNLSSVVSPERLQRSEQLRRIDKAAQKLDSLARQQNYHLTQDERTYLAELIDRLKSILER